MNSVAYNSDENYRYLKHVLQDVFGVVVGDDQESYIIHKLNSVISRNNIDSLHALNARLNHSDESTLRTEVLRAITQRNINDFDYPEINSVFSQYVLPNINKKRADTYRVWVVGCGTGQSAFSLAIVANKYMKREERDLAIEIIATDNMDENIQVAKKARFESYCLTGMTEADKKKYMTRDADAWVFNDAVRSMVQFSLANPRFMNEADMDKVDLIVCPEILVYYTVVVRTQFLKFAASKLRDSGILITGAHEPIQSYCDQFSKVEHDAGVFYRKSK